MTSSQSPQRSSSLNSLNQQLPEIPPKGKMGHHKVSTKTTGPKLSIQAFAKSLNLPRDQVLQHATKALPPPPSSSRPGPPNIDTINAALKSVSRN